MMLKGKRVLIAPFTPTSRALANALLENDSDIQIIGYLDNYKTGENLYSKQQLGSLDYDFVLILSPNHFSSIYKELKSVVGGAKLIKVDIKNYQYQFLTTAQIKNQLREAWQQMIKLWILYGLCRVYDRVGRNPNRFVFLAKSFVGGNVKAFYLYAAEHNKQVTLVTDNQEAYRAFQAGGYQVSWLGSWKSLFKIARAKWIIQDQANHTEYFDSFGKQQKTLQMWHGIPLKKLSPQKNITYDLLLSTSDYVSKTSLAEMFEHRQIINTGYPRNDLLQPGLVKDEYLLTDKTIFDWVQAGRAEAQKILIYMPTHREYDVGIDAPGMKTIPLDWRNLDKDLAKMDCLMVLKLHPFVEAHYQKLVSDLNINRVKVYPAKQDIYPLLTYSDLLITDYSSVYFDYLLLDKPIVFYCYDFQQYADNKDGWTYPFESFTPGEKIYKPCYTSLVRVVEHNLEFDLYAEKRKLLINKLFKNGEFFSKELMFYID
jgi:CDP-glycerol glycerophosphotransferase (TagB/SpsB family)